MFGQCMKMFALVMALAWGAWAQPTQPFDAHQPITNPTFDSAQPLQLPDSRAGALIIDLAQPLLPHQPHPSVDPPFLLRHQTDCITLSAEALAYRYQSIVDSPGQALVIHVNRMHDCVRIDAELAVSGDLLINTAPGRIAPSPARPPRTGRADRANSTRVVSR